MGPRKASLRGMGTGGASLLAPPTSPSSGAGGPGVLGGTGQTAGLSFAPAITEVSDVTTGRITLGLINLTVLAMIGFYVWTRNAQGGG